MGGVVFAEKADRISATCVRFQTDKALEMTPYMIKGAIIEQFPDHPLVPYINGHYRGQLRYPRVQVKILRQGLSVFGIADGYEVVSSFRDTLEKLIVEDQVYTVDGHETVESQMSFDHAEEFYNRYKFITPWVALNNRNLTLYTSLTPRERFAYLNKLLVQNILFLAREFEIEVPYTISVRVKLQSLSPRIVAEQGSGSFKGYFTTNVKLPDYLGLGNGITKGLGTIVEI